MWTICSTKRSHAVLVLFMITPLMILSSNSNNFLLVLLFTVTYTNQAVRYYDIHVNLMFVMQKLLVPMMMSLFL